MKEEQGKWRASQGRETGVLDGGVSGNFSWFTLAADVAIQLHQHSESFPSLRSLASGRKERYQQNTSFHAVYPPLKFFSLLSRSCHPLLHPEFHLTSTFPTLYLIPTALFPSITTFSTLLIL
eukprot:768760-Hanusia_phi.AAC.3